ncbi:MAG: ATP synthase F1 subunit gamma [Deltaproteobacteria bacterium]|nr:ATP synthase F1 subunit gamma [Deltaproteobacteria bacterium]
MAGLKEIRRRISSVKNTKQITRAMKLVSAAKLRRAQDAAISGRMFGSRLKSIIASVVQELPENFEHALLRKTEGTKRRLLIVIAGERGLCGAYNTNIVKAVAASEPQGGVGANVIAVGRRAVSGGRRSQWNILSGHESLPEDPSKWPVDAIAKEAVEEFMAEKYDEVVVYYTKFVSAMTQQVTSEVLFPLSAENLVSKDGDAAAAAHTRFDAPVADMFATLIPLYISARIREAALESKASEHAARMTAMDSASKNASDLIDRLRLFYNRARQSAITTELIHNNGGAEAVK